MAHSKYRRQIFLIAILGAASAQTPSASPQFEVASIKPSNPGNGPIRVGSRGGPGTNDPGLFTCENCGAAMLLRQAFDLQDYQLSDQVWMRSARFNVSAKIPEGATKERFRLMLRNLLTDRLQLKFHYEKKEMQTYELAVIKSGFKMTESAGPANPDETPASTFKIDADGFPVLPLTRDLAFIKTADGHAALRQAGTSLEDLARILMYQLGRPVTDATGLKGKYDFSLRWIAESAPSPADETGPNIFRAVQEQLGLKLESKKAMVEVLMVDHIEKIPTDN